MFKIRILSTRISLPVGDITWIKLEKNQKLLIAILKKNKI